MSPATQQLCENDLSEMRIDLENCLGPIELLIAVDVAEMWMRGRLKMVSPLWKQSLVVFWSYKGVCGAD